MSHLVQYCTNKDFKLAIIAHNLLNKEYCILGEQ